MNSLGSAGEEGGMDLGGGEEEESKEGHKGEEAEGCEECGGDWFNEVDDSWYPGMYIITKTEEVEEERQWRMDDKEQKGKSKAHHERKQR